MWKPEHRKAVDRRGLRPDSDMMDVESALIDGLFHGSAGAAALTIPSAME